MNNNNKVFKNIIKSNGLSIIILTLIFLFIGSSGQVFANYADWGNDPHCQPPYPVIEAIYPDPASGTPCLDSNGIQLSWYATDCDTCYTYMSSDYNHMNENYINQNPTTNRIYNGPGYYISCTDLNCPTGPLAEGTTYYWRAKTIKNCYGTNYRFSNIWSFSTTSPTTEGATLLNPPDEASGMDLTAMLTWTAGAGAISHDVYFGTTNTPPFRVNQTDTYYDTGTLNIGTTYYWRIGERGCFGDPVLSDIHSFTTRCFWHVDAYSEGGDGKSWSQAFKYLQDALTIAESYDEIWVARGTYRPDQSIANTNGSNSPTATFTLKNGVVIYGGFDGNETSVEERDWLENETVLTGQLTAENSYHVITASDTNASAILDGLTITAGNAKGSWPDNCGGGMYSNNGGPTIINCLFSYNNASSLGGAIYDNNGSSTFTNCEFNDNNSTSYGGAVCDANGASSTFTNCVFQDNNSLASGGAIYDHNLANPVITNCIFSANKSNTSGGGIYNSQSSPVLTNCVFYNNSTNGSGGAIRNTGLGSKPGSPLIKNCVFSRNEANNGGVIYNSVVASPTIINCTFNNNTALQAGGSMYNSNSTYCDPYVNNCIFWGNSAPNNPEIYKSEHGDPNFRFCDIAGCGGSGSGWDPNFGIDGGGNIDLAPHFVNANNPLGPDGIWFTPDDGLRLELGGDYNPCIDAADGNIAPQTDIIGSGRIDVDFVPNTGIGEPNYADIGAYESDAPWYITSFEEYQGYGDYGSDINGVDGWDVAEGSSSASIAVATYTEDINYPYQYVTVSGSSTISYNTGGPSGKSFIRISCIPSPGSYINVRNGDVNIASIKFETDANMYVLNNGTYYMVTPEEPNYMTVANKCYMYLTGNDTNEPYSYENSWIEFTIRFDWLNHTYDVNWAHYGTDGEEVVYEGAHFDSSHHSFTKVEFIAGSGYSDADTYFSLNRMSISDTDLPGGVLGPQEDVWLTLPDPNLTEPLSGHIAVAGQMWYSKLGQYIVKCCPSDLNPDDVNSWLTVCSGRTVNNFPITLGYWNTENYYNGDYSLKVEVYDDIDRLIDSKTITTIREYNGRYETVEARYPIIGRFKPQSFHFEELPDFKINWPGTFPFEFKRSYNSSMRNRLYPLFFGWTHNHNIRLIEDCTSDWTKDVNERPVRDANGLSSGRLWLNSPSGGGLFTGQVDVNDTNRVIYSPQDKQNHKIIRTLNSVNKGDPDAPIFNVTYVYYGPTGMKMTFNKEFTVGYPIPENEGLVGWFVMTGIDSQEDRFGNTLIYEYLESDKINLDKISNNRTPANLRFFYGTYGVHYVDDLYGRIEIYNGENPADGYVTFGFLVWDGDNASWGSVYGGDETASNFIYHKTENGYMVNNLYLYSTVYCTGFTLSIDITYDDEGVLVDKHTHPFSLCHDQSLGNYEPIEKYSYSYDETGNLTTTIDVNSKNDLAFKTPLRTEVIVTSSDGALLSRNTKTYDANFSGMLFEPNNYEEIRWNNSASTFRYHAGGGGAIDADYFYEDGRFPTKPTTIIEYFDEDGNDTYSGTRTSVMEYDTRGNVTGQKVYVDEVNYVYTELEYHPIYDLPVRKTTWQGFCHDDGPGEVNTSGAIVEKLWLYGNADGTIAEDGNFLVCESTLLDEVNDIWADVNYIYDANSQLKRQIDPEGGITCYAYDVNGFIRAQWDGANLDESNEPTGNPQKRFFFDGPGNKVLEADYLGKVIMSVFDGFGRVRQERQYIDEDAVNLSIIFDSLRYDIAIADDNAVDDWWETRKHFEYYTGGQQPTVVWLPTFGYIRDHFFRNEKGLASVEHGEPYYFATYILAADDGRILTTNDYSEVRNVYDSMKRLIHKYTIFDDYYFPEWEWDIRYIRHEAFSYDASGNKTGEKVYKVTLDINEELVPAFTAVLEKENSYEYDILGRLIKQVIDSNEEYGVKQTTQFGYDAAGNRTYVIDPNGNTIKTDYDCANRVIREYFTTKDTENAKVKKEISYYKNGKIKDVNSYGYDGELLAHSRYEYDSRGRIVSVTEDINEVQSATTLYDYNDAGIDIEDPCGYTYQIKITDAEGKNTWISLYPLGSPQKIIYPSGDYEEYIYYSKPLSECELVNPPQPNFNGLLAYKAVWDSQGEKQYITYEYEEGSGKISKIIYPDAGYMEYTYAHGTGQFGGGLPATITDFRDVNDRPGSEGSTYSFEYYYNSGKIKSFTDCDGFTVNYDYSLAYNQTTDINVTDPNGTSIYDVNYVYDRIGRLTDVCEPMLGANNLIANFEYDKNGNRSKLRYLLDGSPGGDTVAIDYSYNLDNMLTSFATTGGPTFTLGNVTVDGLGRLKQSTETLTKTNQTTVSHQWQYDYDMRSQLTFAGVTNVGIYSWISDSYSYDKAGNVTSHKRDDSLPSSVTTPFTYDGDIMTQIGDADLTWNDNGNLISKDESPATSIEYNWDNKLRAAAKGTEGISVKYDPLGNRVVKVNDTSTRKYVIDVSGNLPTILLELDPCDGMVIEKTYIYANAEVLAQHDGDVNASRYFYLHDRLGSVREVIDTDGDVVLHYTYGPFGQTIESGGTLTNPFMFTGQYYDAEIGQYYLRARQYDPQLMRFTGKDPVKGKFQKPLTLHAYLYCNNNAVNRTDPNGQDSIDAYLTGVALYTHAIDLAAYAASSEDWRYFDLAGLTIEFMPIGMSIAALMPTSYLGWMYFVGGNSVTSLLEYEIHATGMSYPEALAVDPVAFWVYTMVMLTGEFNLGITFDDMENFADWHSEWW